MRHDIKLAACVLTVTAFCGLFAQSASAQFSSSSRTGSASGTAFTNSSTSSQGATSGFGNTARATGGNVGGVGNGAANRTAGTGQSALGQSLFTQGNNQNGFIGGRNQQQQFIGGNQRTGQQQTNQMGNRGQSGRMNLDDVNAANQQNQPSQNQRRAIRPQQKIAFEVPRRTETEIRSTLQTRFDGLSQQPALRDVTFELDGKGVATLRGSVETESAKQLAANFVRLEPGVRKVVNELTVP